ncbi:hypothetical protein B0H14DRAFT_2801161, partial [Mycena olivaceomarginata]
MRLLATIQFGGGFASGFVIVLFPALKDRTKVRVSGQVWIFTQVTADLIIAGALVYEFQKAKSKLFEGRHRTHPYLPHSLHHIIQNTLNCLLVLTLQTGSAMAVIAPIFFIFSINDDTKIPVGIICSLSRVYVLTMVRSLRQDTSQAPTSVAWARGTGTSSTDGLRGVQFQSAIIRRILLRCVLFLQFNLICTQLTTSQLHTTAENRTFKSGSTMSHTMEGSPTEIEMTATDSSKET